MKDKLQSLIDTFFSSIDIDKFYSQNQKEKLADWLRENGVIVPPCKVGDTVYIKNHEITINEVFLGEELLFSTYFDCDWVMENIGCEDCPFADWEQSYEGEWDCRSRGWFSFAEKDIGKTVFLTREEAEQALKGGAER